MLRKFIKVTLWLFIGVFFKKEYTPKQNTDIKEDNLILRTQTLENIIERYKDRLQIESVMRVNAQISLLKKEQELEKAKDIQQDLLRKLNIVYTEKHQEVKSLKSEVDALKYSKAAKEYELQEIKKRLSQ